MRGNDISKVVMLNLGPRADGALRYAGLDVMEMGDSVQIMTLRFRAKRNAMASISAWRSPRC